LLVITALALLFQHFPSLWWGLLGVNTSFWRGLFAIVDVRAWTWRSWAVASTIWIVSFVAIKVWWDADSR
jgi:hypothetical protein